MSLGVSSGTAPSSRESCRRRRRRTRRGLREVPGTGGRERCTWEDRASHIGVRRPKTSGVINATVRGRRYRGSRGGTRGSTADGPRHGSERGDGNPPAGTEEREVHGLAVRTRRRTAGRTGVPEPSRDVIIPLASPFPPCRGAAVKVAIGMSGSGAPSGGALGARGATGRASGRPSHRVRSPESLGLAGEAGVALQGRRGHWQGEGGPHGRAAGGPRGARRPT